MPVVPFRCAVLGLVLFAACGAPSTAADAGSAVDAGAAQDAGPGASAALTVSAAFQTSTMTRTGNVLNVHVTDGAGAAVTGATVTVELYMPAHGHGAPAPSVTELGNGDYQAGAVNFSMAGDWDVTCKAVKGALTGTQKLSVTAP